MVEINADCDDVANKDENYFRNFDVVCATCCPTKELLRINDVCHRNKIMFYAGDVYGFYSFMFADLNEHEFAE